MHQDIHSAAGSLPPRNGIGQLRVFNAEYRAKRLRPVVLLEPQLIIGNNHPTGHLAARSDEPDGNRHRVERGESFPDRRFGRWIPQSDSRADFLRAGAIGVGVGGQLVNREWIDAGEFYKIASLAGKIAQAAQNAVK